MNTTKQQEISQSDYAQSVSFDLPKAYVVANLRDNLFVGNGRIGAKPLTTNPDRARRFAFIGAACDMAASLGNPFEAYEAGTLGM